jgi:hypothetical protein
MQFSPKNGPLFFADKFAVSVVFTSGSAMSRMSVGQHPHISPQLYKLHGEALYHCVRQKSYSWGHASRT